MVLAPLKPLSCSLVALTFQKEALLETQPEWLQQPFMMSPARLQFRGTLAGGISSSVTWPSHPDGETWGEEGGLRAVLAVKGGQRLEESRWGDSEPALRPASWRPPSSSSASEHRSTRQGSKILPFGILN